MFHSLRSRLIASYVAVILLTLCLVGTGLLVLLQDYQYGIVSQRLTDALGPSAGQARVAWRRGSSPAQIAAELQEQLNPDWRVLLITEQGQIIADSKQELVGRQLPRILVLQTVGRFRFATGRQLVAGRELIFAAAPIGAQGEARMFLVLATVVHPLIGSLQDLARPLLTAAIIALAIAILLALLLARSIAQPLGQLTRATEALAQGRYDEQIPEHGHDEVARLAARFNAMARAIKHAQRVQKDFVANVSHELKTPLTSIQGFSQAIMEGATRDMESARYAAKLIHEEAQRMARLVADLLTLARWDVGDVPLQLQTLDLATMLPAWVERFQARAQEAGLTLTLTLDSPPPIVGDAGRLEQVVANLIDNAIKYNRAGGRVMVYAGRGMPPSAVSAPHPKATTTYALIRVSDTGQGIPAAAQPRIFERFFRADPARVAGGSGLGLAIAQEIVKAHHGEITFASREGEGTTFNVWLPAKP